MNSFSIIIPIFNEEENLPRLVDELEGVAKALKKNIEIVFVDDSSTDSSLKVLKDLEVTEVDKVIIRNEKNLGQGISVLRGVKVARYDYVLTMDGDLQVDPNEIKNIINTAQTSNVDFICTKRSLAKERAMTKHMPSILGNKLISIIFKTSFSDIGSSLKLFKREDVASLREFKNIHRYLSLILNDIGKTHIEIEINHRERIYGKSKYSFYKFIGVLFELSYLKRYLKQLPKNAEIIATRE